jgi:hypothetical protein
MLARPAAPAGLIFLLDPGIGSHHSCHGRNLLSSAEQQQCEQRGPIARSISVKSFALDVRFGAIMVCPKQQSSQWSLLEKNQPLIEGP